MEATGDYWKPFVYLLEYGPFDARHVKNLPRAKDHISDAACPYWPRPTGTDQEQLLD